MCTKVKNVPSSLDIYLTKPSLFKYKIITVFYNQNGEDYAQGEETAYSLKEAITVIKHNMFWANFKKGIKRDCIHIFNETNKYVNI